MLNDTQKVDTSPQPPIKRSSLYLLTGLALGVILGLIYAWLVNPVIYENTTPASLIDADKDLYRSTIARVYAVTGDFERAALRLALLDDPDPVFALESQAQRALGLGDDAEARALALLAAAFQGSPHLQAPNPDTTTPLFTPTEPLLPSVPTYTLPIPTSTP